MVATASWDKTLKYWDLRQQQPVSTVQLPERAYTMDTAKSLLVVGTAERHVCIINLNNPGAIFRTGTSPLKWQTRTIACHPNGDGYSVGSIEGRCGIQYVDLTVNQTFAFRSSATARLWYPHETRLLYMPSLACATTPSMAPFARQAPTEASITGTRNPSTV